MFWWFKKAFDTWLAELLLHFLTEIIVDVKRVHLVAKVDLFLIDVGVVNQLILAV